MNSTFVRAGAPLALLIGAAFPSQAARPVPCDSLLGSFIEGATITSAQLNAASAGVPEHCEVVGAIAPRTGLDGQPYAIKFHLRLPTAWNERFFFAGGGGPDGNLGSADGAQLNQGYAVVSTDSGHDNAVNISALAGTVPSSASTRRRAATTATTARRASPWRQRRSSRPTTGSGPSSRTSKAAPKADARA